MEEIRFRKRMYSSNSNSKHCIPISSPRKVALATVGCCGARGKLDEILVSCCSGNVLASGIVGGWTGLGSAAAAS